MALLSVQDVTVRFTNPPLLQSISLQIESGERVCLLGRNGTGKSTLMKLLAEQGRPDSGLVTRRPGLRVAYMPQEVPQDLAGTAYEVVHAGLQGLDWRDEASEAPEEWQRQQQVERVLSQFGIDSEAEVSVLSAGWRRRVFLARGLVSNPHVLLLDEPTNHLDIESIDWLEKFLLRYEGTLVFVTHDRVFVRKLATRIVEIDRGQLYSWACDYETYLQRKEEALEIEATQAFKFDKKLAQEEEWLRRGPKARRSRNEGRVRALMKLRDERRQRRDVLGAVRMQVQEADKSGDLVIEAKQIAYQWEDMPIVNDLSLTIMRGDKLGVIGPNGVGKTTLLRLLLKQIPLQSGTVRHGTRLEIAYFDQLRAQLDEDKSVVDNVGGGSDQVVVQGKPRHIIGYLGDFLFTPDRAWAPVRILSGGERNRVLLAKLFTNPANVLVLDEPTNDLDAETLELLESLLVEFSGTVLMVSHDREFLNNVVTSTLAMEGGGVVKEYVGGYDDWLWQRKQEKVEQKEKRVQEARKTPEDTTSRPKKLSFNEKRLYQQQYQELQALPHQIETLEQEQEQIHQQMASPSFYKQTPEQIAAVQDHLAQLEQTLAETYQRWETLETQFADFDLKQIE